MLAACGGDEATPPLIVNPTPTPTPTPTPSPTPGPVLTSDIQYGEGATTNGNIPLLFDLYAPDEPCTANRPTVLFAHGGGFVGGSKSDENVPPLAQEMVSRGINFVSIDYRLDPQNPLPSQPFVDVLDDIAEELGGDLGDTSRADAIAAAIEDTVTALNFLESNQDNLCVDTDRIAYWGSSAGAFTVLQVGYGLNQFGIQRPEPAAVVDYWGRLFRVSDMEVGEAPFLVLHGTNDPTVDFQNAVDITNQAGVVGLDFAFYTVTGGGHGFNPTGTFTLTVDGQTLLERTADFIEAHLTGGTPIYGRFEVQR